MRHTRNAWMALIIDFYVMVMMILIFDLVMGQGERLRLQ